MPQKTDKNITLEAALVRLDQVVKSLEKENIDLDASLRLYEEGIALVRVCNERLNDAERRIKVLRMSNDGEVSEEDFAHGDKREDV